MATNRRKLENDQTPLCHILEINVLWDDCTFLLILILSKRVSILMTIMFQTQGGLANYIILPVVKLSCTEGLEIRLDWPFWMSIKNRMLSRTKMRVGSSERSAPLQCWYWWAGTAYSSFPCSWMVHIIANFLQWDRVRQTLAHTFDDEANPSSLVNWLMVVFRCELLKDLKVVTFDQ